MLTDDGGFPNIDTQGNPTVTCSGGNALQFPTGNFAPFSPLSALDGENADGTWVVNVSDNVSGDVGSVRRFSLIFNGSNRPLMTESNADAFTPSTSVARTNAPSVVTGTVTVSDGAGGTCSAAASAGSTDLAVKITDAPADNWGRGGRSVGAFMAFSDAATQ